jgi:hypothetical protein
VNDHYWTIPQVARYLEITERRVRDLVLAGTLQPLERRGPGGAYLIPFAEIEHYGRTQGLGEIGRRQRLVLLVGGTELDEHELALQVSGLTTERAPSILAAVSQHDVAGAPIVVVSAEAAQREITKLRERGVLRELSSMLFLACVTPSAAAVPWVIERQACVCDPWEHRRLVLWAWRALEDRHRAGSLDLTL